MSGVPLWLGVAALGGAGALARHALESLIAARSDGPFRLGTLAVNVSGSLVLGGLVGVTLSGPAMLLAGTALIGSYTTFSGWMLETVRLAGEGRRRLAALDVALSVVLGIAAVAAGRWLVGG